MKKSVKRKLLGQHLLTDKNSISTIVNTFFKEFNKTPCDQILEIGPGKGALTYTVLDFFKTHPQNKVPYILIEKDFAFCEHWEEEKQNHPLQLIANDFLNLKETDYLTFPKTSVLSNLPYSVGTRILNTLACYPKKIPFLLIMLQKEVAQRIYAQPHSKNFGSLSIWIQNHWHVSPILSVPPSHFTPPPKVDSEVILMRARPQSLIQNSYQSAHSLKVLERFLKNAFSQKRKMIRGAFKVDANLLESLKQTDLDPTRRSETLSFEEWNILFQKYLVLNKEKGLLGTEQNGLTSK